MSSNEISIVLGVPLFLMTSKMLNRFHLKNLWRLLLFLVLQNDTAFFLNCSSIYWFTTVLFDFHASKLNIAIMFPAVFPIF